MIMSRIAYLSLHGVSEVAGAEVVARFGRLRVGVSGLDHEPVDYTVEKHTVVSPVVDQSEEIVAMEGSVVVKAYSDGAQ